jgi:hypothetical protein
MKKVIIVVLIIVMVLISSGCKNHVRQPYLWWGPDADWQTVMVAIDVGPDGAKHLLWTDCTMALYCRLIYQKTYNGEASTVTQVYAESWDSGDPTPQYVFPDIAVADDGSVYIVWHLRYSDGRFYDCWNYISADGLVDDNACHQLQDTGMASTVQGRPKVITYDNVAYAVYAVDDGSENLFYRQLAPLDESHGKVNVAGGGSDNPSLAVSTYLDGAVTKYILHVSWSNNDGGPTSVSVYNSNYLSTGDMTNEQMSADPGERSDAVIRVVNSYNRLFFTARREGTPDILSLAYCVLPACTTFEGTDTILDPAVHWELYGTPDMAWAIGTTVVVSFLATNDTTEVTTTEPEIFTVAYTAGDHGPNTTNRITANDVEESNPRMALGFPWLVLAWRNRGTAGGALRDLYIYDNVTSTVRQLYESPGDIVQGVFDIAYRVGNTSVDMGGIFLDHASDTGTWSYPWVVMNSEGYYLPVILKP